MKFLLHLALLPIIALAAPTTTTAPESIGKHLVAVRAAKADKEVAPKDNQELAPAAEKKTEEPAVEASSETPGAVTESETSAAPFEKPTPVPETEPAETEVPAKENTDGNTVKEAGAEAPVGEASAVTAPEAETPAPAAGETAGETSPGTEGGSSSSSSSSSAETDKPSEGTKAEEPSSPADVSTSSESGEETLPEATTPTITPLKKHVLAKFIKTGAEANFKGVTIRFSLQNTWTVEGEKRRAYQVKIITKETATKSLCGVTFSNNTPVTDVLNLFVGEDGSLTTKDLELAPGKTANQFGYVTSARSRPTILAVTYC